KWFASGLVADQEAGAACSFHGGCRINPLGALGVANRLRRRPDQALAAAIRWLWRRIRLFVAVMRRHSERHAARPRRKKRSSRRLNFTCANTGSTVAMRLR